MPLSTYDPSKVIVNVGGANIEGFADGTFVKVTRSTDTFTKVTGSDNRTTRIKQNDRSGVVEITLMQSSQSNAILDAIASIDDSTGAGVVPVLVKDLLGTTLHSTPAAWVKKPADSEFSKTNSNRVWVLECADLSMKNGGNPYFV